jgi:hypothetical protein
MRHGRACAQAGAGFTARGRGGLALLPSQAWMWKLATGVRAAAEPAAAVGIVDPEFANGENVPHEIAAAIAPLRDAARRCSRGRRRGGSGVRSTGARWQ